MKALLKKVRGDKKGFTLAELLVAVAIVAILVAISVPIFTSQLGKAKQATNEANMRAAKVAAVAKYLSDENDGDTVYYLYDIEQGVVTTPGTSFKSENYTITAIDGASHSKVYKTGDIAVSVKAGDPKADEAADKVAVVNILIKN